MSAERRIEVGVPGADRDVAEAVHEVVNAAFADARLLSTPQVELVNGPIVGVRVDRESVPLSPRRVEQAVLAATGSVRRQDERKTTLELMRTRLAAADPATTARVVGGLVDAALRAARPLLVRAERAEIARRLAGRADDVDSLAEVGGQAHRVGE